jgi:hypothetical protein
MLLNGLLDVLPEAPWAASAICKRKMPTSMGLSSWYSASTWAMQKLRHTVPRNKLKVKEPAMARSNHNIKIYSYWQDNMSCTNYGLTTSWSARPILIATDFEQLLRLDQRPYKVFTAWQLLTSMNRQLRRAPESQLLKPSPSPTLATTHYQIALVHDRLYRHYRHDPSTPLPFRHQCDPADPYQAN